jgi:hypothetical protein
LWGCSSDGRARRSQRRGRRFDPDHLHHNKNNNLARFVKAGLYILVTIKWVTKSLSFYPYLPKKSKKIFFPIDKDIKIAMIFNIKITIK